MDVVAKIVYGSYLYGTVIRGSDKDYKVVYIPNPKDILLGRTPDSRDWEGNGDTEYLTLQKYMRLLCEGQTMALDLLFAPDTAHAQPCGPAWRAIQALAPAQWISRDCQASVGYCRQQVNKYLVKQERYEALVRAVSYLNILISQYGTEARLIEFFGRQGGGSFVKLSSLTEIVDIRLGGGNIVPHLSVCGLKIPLTAALRVAQETYRRRMEVYGKRVQSPEGTSIKDWKSMYHAVRVAREAVELLETGKLTFPRPEAELLLAIRQGKVPFEEVGSLISRGLVEVERAVLKSKLRDKADQEAAEGLVLHFYRAAVKEMGNGR